MTVTLNTVKIFNGNEVTPTAPLIEGSTPTTLIASNITQGGGFQNANGTGRRGCRITFAGGAQDFTTHQFVGFGLYTEAYGAQINQATLANGGMRAIFIDGSGNYAGFNIYGGNVVGIDGGNGPSLEGMYGAYQGVDLNSNARWFIDRTRTPDISGGSINWAAVTAVEFSQNYATSSQYFLYMHGLSKVSRPTITGTENFASMEAAINVFSTGTNQRFPNLLVRPYWFQQSAAQIAYAAPIGFNIGNGSTTTTFVDSAFAMGFLNTYDKAPAYRTTGPVVQLNSTNDRFFIVNQSATDTLTLTDGSFASAAWWNWQLSGSGTATLTRIAFWRFNQFLAAHGNYNTCSWNAGTAPVEITASTTITSGSILNATTTGLKILGAAGTYAMSCLFNNPSATADIELGSGGAGTYTLANISVPASYTLKIRNNSATNAITVAIPAGIAYSTSTAGGSITISTPATYQSVTVNGLVSGSRLQIYDLTSGTQLANVSVVGTSYTWTDSVAAAANRAIRVRIAYVSGATAKAFIEAGIGTCGTSGSNAAISYLANQVDDAVYITNGITGSGVTGITIAPSPARVAINIAGGAVTWPQIYAYQVYWLATSAGIADEAAFITAPDTANYLFTNFDIKNTNATPLTITGGYGRDAVTGQVKDLIDVPGSTGNIYPMPDHVVPFSTGSGLTAGQDANLTAIRGSTQNLTFTGTKVQADIQAVRGQSLKGDGSNANPWNPV